MMRVVMMAALLACASTATAKTSGWRPLFNGTDLAGWRAAEGGPAPTKWQVEDGTITLRPAGPQSDLLSVDEFGDFELELEWKISEGGNSGIFYFVRDIGGVARTVATGVEMQVLDDARHGDGKLPSHRAGALYDLIPTSVAAAVPVGAWNKVRIVVRRGRIEHWLNGKRVVATQYGDTAWNQRVAGSKFKAMPDFAKQPRGHIALQDHGDRVWYRNIRVRTF